MVEGWNIVRLPFAGDRWPIVRDVVSAHFRLRPRADCPPVLRRNSATKDAVGTGAAAGFGARLLYIGESYARATEVRRRLSECFGLAPPGHYHTIDGVVAALAEEHVFRAGAGVGYVAPPTDALMAMLIREGLASAGLQAAGARAVDEMRAALGRVRVAAPPSDRMGLLERIESALGASPMLARRISLVRRVLQHVEKGFRVAGRGGDRWIVDPGDFEWLLAAEAKEALSGYEVVIVDDVFRLGPAQWQMLDAIGGAVPHAYFVHRSSVPDSLQERVLAPVSRRLESSDRVTVAAAPGDSRRAAIIKAWLEYDRGAEERAVVNDPTMVVAKYASSQSEARSVVARVKALHVLGGVPLNDIGVCLVDKSGEEALARELQRAGVAHARSSALSVAMAPSIQAVMGLLEAADEGWPFEATVTALRSPWLEGLARLVQGADSKSWEWELGRLANQVRKSANQRSGLTGGDAGGSPHILWEESIRGGGEKGETLYERWRPVLELLGTLGTARTVADLAAALLVFVRRGGIESMADEHNRRADFDDTPFSEGTNLRWNARCVEALVELLEDVLRAEGAGIENRTAGVTPIAEVRRQLLELSKPMRKAPDAVRLVGLLDVRGSEFPWLFVCGLHSAALPFRDPENSFLPRRLRELTHPGESMADERAAIETLAEDVNPVSEYRHLLACAIANGVERLELSWPGVVDDGEVAPSIPLRDLMELLGVAEKGTGSATATGLALEARPLAPVVEMLAGRGATVAPSLRNLSMVSLVDVQREMGMRAAAALESGGDVTESPGELDAWPALVRAQEGIAVEMSRDEGLNLDSPWVGLLVSDAGRKSASLQAKEGERVPVTSATRIEDYAKCPMRYLMKHVMGVPEPEPVSDELTPANKGWLLHGLFEAYLVRMREDLVAHEASGLVYPGELLGWDAGATISEGSAPDDRYRAARAGLGSRSLPLVDFDAWRRVTGRSTDELMCELIAEWRGRSGSLDWENLCDAATSDLRSWDGESSRGRTEIGQFLDTEEIAQGVASDSVRLVPWLMEMSFGDETAWVLRQGDTPLLGMRGKVDRVDALVRTDESGTELLGLVVRDYKTGSADLSKRLRKGTAFQLPLYAAATLDVAGRGKATLAGFFLQVLRRFRASQDLKKRFDVVYADLALQSLMREAKLSNARAFDDPREMVERIVPDRVGQLLDSMASGAFHLPLIDGTSGCEWCDYRAACALREGQQDLLATVGEDLATMGIASRPYFPTSEERQ